MENSAGAAGLRMDGCISLNLSAPSLYPLLGGLAAALCNRTGREAAGLSYIDLFIFFFNIQLIFIPIW